MLAPVLLTTEILIVFVVGHLIIVRIPLVDGTYPVTASGLLLKSNMMVSVDANPVQVCVTVVAAAPDAIKLVPSATVPEQMVCVRLENATPVSCIFFPLPPEATFKASPAVTFPVIWTPPPGFPALAPAACWV
jgi:hypothetical protein